MLLWSAALIAGKRKAGLPILQYCCSFYRHLQSEGPDALCTFTAAAAALLWKQAGPHHRHHHTPNSASTACPLSPKFAPRLAPPPPQSTTCRHRHIGYSTNAHNESRGLPTNWQVD